MALVTMGIPTVTRAALLRVPVPVTLCQRASAASASAFAFGRGLGRPWQQRDASCGYGTTPLAG